MQPKLCKPKSNTDICCDQFQLEAPVKHRLRQHDILQAKPLQYYKLLRILANWTAEQSLRFNSYKIFKHQYRLPLFIKMRIWLFPNYSSGKKAMLNFSHFI